MNNRTIFKRIGAYLIDFLVITFVSMIITRISFINPKYDEYLLVSSKYNEMLNDYYDKKIDIEEFNKEISNISYDMNKNGYVYVISDMVIIILYFGVFNYVSHGQTLGKKIMNLQIVSAKNKTLKIFNYLVRCILLNGILMDIVTLIAICFKRSTYYEIYNIGSNINMIIQMVIFLSIMFNASGRGLHDIISGTKVINIKDIDQEVKEEDSKVEIIKPAKINKKKKGEENE